MAFTGAADLDTYQHSGAHAALQIHMFSMWTATWMGDIAWDAQWWHVWGLC